MAADTKGRVGRPKGTRASKTQADAGKDNLKKAHKARTERALARKAELEKPRWKQLEDGDISVRDLSMDELVRLEVANNDMSWEGRRRALPARIVGRMEAERVRRLKRDMARLAPAAIDALEDLIDDVDNPSVRFNVAKHILEHNVGKPVEVVHIGQESEWDRLQQGAFIIQRGESAVVDEDEDIVDAEIVEEP